ncbi:MAG: DNA-processing protein DprA [Erythrobacter sp.]
MSLTQPEAFARIRLLRSPNIGPVSYRQLLARFGSAQAAIDELPAMGSRGKRTYRPASRDRIEQEIAGVQKAGASYLFHDQDEYPELLSALESAPPIFTYRGDITMAARPCVAMVGARNASAAAVKLAREFGSALAGQGYTVVSGLARGIDGACHEGALASGQGGTIGVIASGIEIAYPPQHEALQEQIAEEGLLIAEQPPGTEPRGRHFPSRNRIIAGLTAGTVVVEAAPKSGSLITARLAGEAGREVMAIPGSPLDTRSLGCNQLIRDGAVLVQSPEEVMELLESFEGTPRSQFNVAEEREDYDFSELDGINATLEKTDSVTALLSTAPIAVDELVRQAGVSQSIVHMALLELEITGELERHSGGRVSLAG